MTPLSYYDYSVSGSSSQHCSGIFLKLLCLFSSILVHYKNFPRQSVIKCLINTEFIWLPATKFKPKLSHGLTVILCSKGCINAPNKGIEQATNETGPLPLCTFSVMGLSMCSSIFSESSPVRSKSDIINELSGFPNSVPTVRCKYTSSSWHGHTGHAYCICFVGKHECLVPNLVPK